jgi:C4-dicarboxylate-specific signal transduction histidine kinase
VTSRPFPARRLVVRLALVFAVVQLVAAAAVLFTIPAVRSGWLWLPLLGLLAVVDLALLAIFAGWIIRGSMEGSTQGLASDVQRIADGDYHHRVGDPHRPELREIRDSVNRLADRLIADQRLLAANIRSLEETNRELVSVRDQMVQSARLASVGTLASGIAHEVGNPLGAVIAFVDVARMRAERAGEDTEILDSIRSEAIRIDRIVRGLLDYARAPDTSGRPERASHVLAEVRELLQNQGKLDGFSS